MSKLLLYLAWGGFALSLIAPATQEPFMFFPARRMPVAVMLWVSALAAIGLLGRDASAMLVFLALVCFIASPVVANAPRRTLRRALSLPILAGALLAWVALAESIGRTFHDGLIRLDAPMWGYYLFAVSLTLSSAGWAIALFSAEPVPTGSNGADPLEPGIAPWSFGADGASSNRGFPVVVPDKTADPPQSSKAPENAQRP